MLGKKKKRIQSGVARRILDATRHTDLTSTRDLFRRIHRRSHRVAQESRIMRDAFFSRFPAGGGFQVRGL